MRLLSSLILTATLAAAATASPQFDTALALYQERKDAEARAAFEALARSDPKNAGVHHYLGRLASRARDFDAAVKHHEKAVALAPDNSQYHLELGGAYGSKAATASLLGKPSLAGKARTAMEKAVQLDPRNVDARLGLMQFYMQAPGIMGGGMDKAHAQADEILRLDPARGRHAKATLYSREKNYPAAFALWEEVLAEQPDDYSARYQFGRLAAESGQRLDEGLAHLRRCIEQTPPANAPGHAPAHWRIGNILEKQNDKAAAKAAYEASLAVDPKFAQAIESLKKL